MTYAELDVVLDRFLIVLHNVIWELVDRNIIVFNVLHNRA